MQAIYLERQGDAGSLVAGEIPRPSPQDGDVLVKVYATAITPAEFQWPETFHTATGASRSFPIVLSHEFSGVVEALSGDIRGVRVVVLGFIPPGR